MPIRLVSRCLLFALLMLIVIPAARAQEPPRQPSIELDALAAKAVAAIQKSSKLPFSSSKVLVADFVETQGPPSKLGAELSREFSDSLAKHAQGFTVLDRSEYLKKFSSDKLSADSYDKPETLRCYEADFGVMAVVTGTLEDMQDRVALHVEVKRVSDLKDIFQDRISLPFTHEMRASLLKPATVSEPPMVQEAVVWFNREHPPFQGRAVAFVAKEGDGGYSLPTCLYCPRAEYSDVAAVTKTQGVVELKVQIDAEGFPTQITLARGAPCGLNQKAIDDVAEWKFKPANGPDGKPVAVVVPVEVHFRLY